MNQDGLLDALAKLKESRLLPSEVDALLDSFREDIFQLTCSFVSSSRSLGSQSDPAYNDGYTIVCKVGVGESECSIQTLALENARIKSLNDGDSFELNLKILGFDSLHQRVIFGQIVDIPAPVEAELPVEPEDSVETETETIITEDDKLAEVESKPIQVESEPIVRRAELSEEDLPPEELSPVEMEELLRERKSQKRFHLGMKGCGYMLAFFFYGLGGLCFLVGVLSLFDPSEPVLMFLVLGPIFVGVGHIVWRTLRSEEFRNHEFS